MKKVIYDTDNLIYNRFDLIHNGQYYNISYEYERNVYEIQVHIENGIAELNVWGKLFPQEIFDKLVHDIFVNKAVYAIHIVRGGNNYQDMLETTNDIRISLPIRIDDLMGRVERRDRATIRRKLRWLDERIGILKMMVYEKQEIPKDIVETYFKWKYETHKTEYGLTPDDYLEKYYVTDAMLMKAGNIDVAVAFFCQVDDIVFFENFSYNSQLKKYSPGLLMYVKLMEELMHRKCRYLYLGGGGYIYKKRFGAESFTAYSGMIYRQEIVGLINNFFTHRSIRKVAFYGYGVCGHSFYQLSKNLDIDVVYGIDRNSEEGNEIPIYSPENELPRVDAVLITLNNDNEEVEELLNKEFDNVIYWNNILNQIISSYWRETSEDD